MGNARKKADKTEPQQRPETRPRPLSACPEFLEPEVKHPDDPGRGGFQHASSEVEAEVEAARRVTRESLRASFSAAALQGLLANPATPTQSTMAPEVAIRAVKFADALAWALEQAPPPKKGGSDAQA